MVVSLKHFVQLVESFGLNDYLTESQPQFLCSCQVRTLSIVYFSSCFECMFEAHLFQILLLYEKKVVDSIFGLLHRVFLKLCLLRFATLCSNSEFQDLQDTVE